MLHLRKAERPSPRTPGRSCRGRRTVRLVTAGTMLIAPLGAVTLVAQSAMADPPPPCYGSSCVHRDPQGTGCSGSFASSLATVYAPGGGASVTLRWSDWCHANWARFDGGSAPFYWNYWVQTTDGHRETQINNDGSWTLMVNGTEKARACIQGAYTSQYSCTAWY